MKFKKEDPSTTQTKTKIFCHYFAQQLWSIMDELGYTTFPYDSSFSGSENDLMTALDGAHDVLVEGGRP